MKTEIAVNGKLILKLTPENQIEELVLTEMAAGASRGKTVSMEVIPDLNGAVSVAVEK